uniref:G-protein coupled receptors family 1 profile domain-containing protein n=1 Tax=Biomphalaria glabrata TaxID=6526 RepID=A0A2C9M5G7_BIOGL
MEDTMVYSENTLVTTVTTENSSLKLRIAMTSPASITPTKVSYYLCVFKANSLEDLLLLYSIQCYVNPILSLLGLIANSISLVILKRSGFHKPSNILLFGLVIADNMCLLTTMNYGLIVFYFGPNKFYPMLCGFQDDENLNLFLAYSLQIFLFVGYWGRSVNTLIPALITIERLLAVFKPLKFRRIVTRTRTTAAVTIAFMFWLPWTLFYEAINVTLSIRLLNHVIWTIVALGNVYSSNKNIIDFMELYVVDFCVSWFPLVVIVTGCSVLFLKVKLTLRRRRHLTSRQKLEWSPRTTRTLLLTCVIFALTHSASSVLHYTCPMDSQVRVFIRNQFIHLLYLINASSNFVVYITSNKQFSNIFSNMIGWTNSGSKKS